MRRVAVTAYRTVLLTVLATLTAGCALTRSQVKSLRDADANRIRLDKVTQTTVAALNALPSHCGPALDHRSREEEFAVYQVVGRIVRVKREPDHDLHIVLEDPADSRERIIVESDDPDYRGNVSSPFREQIAAARRMTIVRFEVRNGTVTAIGRIVGALADSGGDVLGPVDQELAVAVENIGSTCNQLRMQRRRVSSTTSARSSSKVVSLGEHAMASVCPMPRTK